MASDKPNPEPQANGPDPKVEKAVVPETSTAGKGHKASAPPKTTGGEAPKPAKKSWSNPALRAMGIPRVSLPSRNWMIFWTLLASIGGGIYYDKHQQKKIREKYMKQVEHLSQEIYTTGRLPRRLSIFVAPPPDNFLDESMGHFRRYIKPILNAAAIDFEVYTENRQGDIRAEVAEKIREMRRQRAENLRLEAEHNATERYARSWTKFFKEDVWKVFQVGRKQKAEDEDATKSRHELYEPADVLGLYRLFPKEVGVARDFGDDAALCGGVVCIGRGSYKEYMAGVHEGLLGPLEKPAPVVEDLETVEKKAEESKEKEKEKEKEGLADFETPENEQTNGDKPKPVVAPYIDQGSYAEGTLAPELDFSQVIRNDKNIPVIFEQPIYVFDVPKLTGFTNLPRKICRYFTTRDMAEAVSQKTLKIVEAKSRPFEYKDKYLAKEEELEWPKKWVERGKQKNSEWTRELEVDERVISRMKVFE